MVSFSEHPALATESPSISSMDVIEDLEFLKEETVSIAVLHEQPISDAPSNVYVITDEDIRHSGAIDLPTILRRVPGMEVIQMTGADFNVSVRGDNQLRANKLLVLVDGRSIYLDIQGEVFWKAIPVTLPEIKRIEILKGPASALYGFNAFDGIINIITKTPEEMKGLTLQVGGGELGTLSSAAVYSGAHNSLDYRLSLGRDQTNQWDNRSSLAFRSHKFNALFNYTLDNQSNVSISGGFLDSNRYDGPIVDTVTISQEPSIGYVNLGYKRPNFFVRAWWTRYTQPALTNVNPLIMGALTISDKDGIGPNQVIEANTTNIDIQHTIQIHSTNRLTYGANYRHNQASSNFLIGDSREDRAGLYIQDEWNMIPKLTVVAGVRLDLDTFINPTYSPRFSLIYKFVPDHTLRASFAQAYRSPTIFEERTLSRGSISLPPPLPSLSTTLQGSRRLGPEEITSYEIGYQGWYFKHRLRTRIDLFFNHISNLINRNGSATMLTFFNGAGPGPGGGSADIYGFETGAEFLVTPWLTGFANYSFQEIGQTFTASNRAKRHGPRNKVNTGLRAEFESGISGEAIMHYVGPSTYAVDPSLISLSPPAGTPATKVGSYVLLNLRGGYKFWEQQGRKRAEVSVSVFNALNDKHKEHPLGETIGSRVMGWLTLHF